MYLIDLGKRLGDKNNIGIIIFLILNTLLIMAIFRDPLIGLTVYLISLAIALSPIGEWILRLQQGCKPIKRREHVQRLMPLFNEVYEKAKVLDPNISKNIKLFINKEKAPNAFATGRNTICLTKGLLSLSDEEIKATLAHEFGHLSKKDTDFILLIAVGNLIVSAIFVVFRAVFWVAGTITSIMNRSFGSLVFTFLVDLVLVGLMWLWTKFGILLVNHSMRKTEYVADEFAYKMGYGDNLISLLDHLDSLDDEGYEASGLFANLASTHPDTDLRVANIQELQEQSIA